MGKSCLCAWDRRLCGSQCRPETVKIQKTLRPPSFQLPCQKAEKERASLAVRVLLTIRTECHIYLERLGNTSFCNVYTPHVRLCFFARLRANSPIAATPYKTRGSDAADGSYLLSPSSIQKIHLAPKKAMGQKSDEIGGQFCAPVLPI